MGSWAEEELKYADLGDVRRNRRLVDCTILKNAAITVLCSSAYRTSRRDKTGINRPSICDIEIALP